MVKQFTLVLERLQCFQTTALGLDEAYYLVGATSDDDKPVDSGDRTQWQVLQRITRPLGHERHGNG
jgi:hypothetical protein